MFGIAMLDVLIGLVFVYLLLALVCTSVNELLAGWLDRRGNHLKTGICNLLGEHDGPDRRRTPVPFHDPQSGAVTNNTMVKAFYDHPLIKTLHEDGTQPSYIPAATFSLVMLDLFAPADGQTPRSIPAFVNGVEKALTSNPDLQRTLLVLSNDVADIAQLRTALEGWFNNAMDRVSAWYKNKSQKWVFATALLVCFLINADSLQLAKDLYQNPTQRSAIVAQAEQMVKDSAPATATVSTGTAVAGAFLNKEEAERLANTIGKLNKTGFSWGWSAEQLQILRSGEKGYTPLTIVLKLLGILLTAVAASLGAPFWFDMLNKLVNIRAVGKAPLKTPATPEPAVSAPTASPVAMQSDRQVQSVG